MDNKRQWIPPLFITVIQILFEMLWEWIVEKVKKVYYKISKCMKK